MFNSQGSRKDWYAGLFSGANGNGGMADFQTHCF